VDPVPDPLLLRKSGSARNRTRVLWKLVLVKIIFYVKFCVLFISLWGVNADVLIVKNVLNTQVVLENSRTIVVPVSVKEDEGGSQGHTQACYVSLPRDTAL
jgi:hypothetical protein